MRRACLDLGSNTFLLLIVEVEKKGSLKVLRDEVQMVRLAEGVNDSGRLCQPALNRARACLRTYAQICAELEVEQKMAVATSAARDAENGQELIRLGDEFGFPIHIIPGEAEAQISYSGACFDVPALVESPLVLDIGGGSTELIVSSEKNQGLPEGVSLNIGSVRLYEMFFEREADSVVAGKKALAYCQGKLVQVLDFLKGRASSLVAVAGTPTTLACLINGADFTEETVHGKRISLAEVKAWREKLLSLSLKERSELLGMPQGREDVIVVGLTILEAVLEVFQFEEFFVSTKGVRFGLALHFEDLKKGRPFE